MNDQQARPANTFTAAAWVRLWSSLDAETKDEIRGKARWEHITLSAALRWMRPDLWHQLVSDQ